MPSGQQTIAGYTAGTAASSPTYRYVYASYIDEPVMRVGALATERLYYHRNQQYSVTALTDSTGTISERYAYDAYGKLTVLAGGGTVLSGSAYDNRYTYTGREWDGDLGLYHYRARMYDPVAGRFCSRDPVSYTDSASLYCASMSLMLVDPAGNAGVWEPRDPRHGGPHPRVLLPPDFAPEPPVAGGPVAGGPAAFTGPPVLCGTVTLGCKSGPVEFPVYGNSRRARMILSIDPNGTGRGCVTLPQGIECTATCEGIKNMRARNGQGGLVPILEHEGCHACLLKDPIGPRKSCPGFGPYIASAGASPDGCVGNEVPAKPNF